MKNVAAITALVATLFIAGRIVHADDSSVNPVKHPVVAYDEHAVKADKKDVQKDETRMIETKQSMKERQDFVAQRKLEYEKAVKDFGSDNDITKQALARYQESEKSLGQSTNQHRKARHEMKEDQKSLDHSKAELKEDRKAAAQK